MKKIQYLLFYFLLGSVIVILSGCSRYTDDFNKYKSQFVLKTLTPKQLAEVLSTTDTAKFLFIDVRDPHSYRNGHIPGAVSVPLKKADAKIYQKYWESDKIKIVYGKNAADAIDAGYWALLNGYKNVFSALGGFDYIKAHLLQSYSPYSGIYGDEKPLFDYAKTFSELVSSSGGGENDASQNIAPTPQVPVVKAGGGAPEGGGCE